MWPASGLGVPKTGSRKLTPSSLGYGSPWTSESPTMTWTSRVPAESRMSALRLVPRDGLPNGDDESHVQAATKSVTASGKYLDHERRMHSPHGCLYAIVYSLAGPDSTLPPWSQ